MLLTCPPRMPFRGPSEGWQQDPSNRGSSQRGGLPHGCQLQGIVGQVFDERLVGIPRLHEWFVRRGGKGPRDQAGQSSHNQRSVYLPVLGSTSRRDRSTLWGVGMLTPLVGCKGNFWLNRLDDRNDEIARLKSKVGEINMDNELLYAPAFL